VLNLCQIKSNNQKKSLFPQILFGQQGNRTEMRAGKSGGYFAATQRAGGDCHPKP
jgi:hypothetical protein